MPGMSRPRGLVSGVTMATPNSAATRWAPALVMKFSSVQVRPESQYSTGTGPTLAWGGRNTPKRMVQPVCSETWLYTPCVPSKHRFWVTVVMVLVWMVLIGYPC